jgi:hypothetical protein
MLTIHLGQDENDCFSAWVSTKEAGLSAGEAADQKGLRLSYQLVFLHCLEKQLFCYLIIIFFSKLWQSSAPGPSRALVASFGE